MKVGSWFGTGSTTAAACPAVRWSALPCRILTRSGHQIDIVFVYKVERLTRSLVDFAKLVEAFDDHDVSFVSVTQSVRSDDIVSIFCGAIRRETAF